MKEEEFKNVYKKAFMHQKFTSFDTTPIGSASIGQVHVAYIGNEKVAVKLLREGIKKKVSADIKIINFFHSLFKPLFSFYTKNSIDAVISEFSLMIVQEVSLNQERNNLLKFAKVYEKSSNIYFPKVYEEYSNDDALVMSYEDGFRFDDKENIQKHNIDFRKVIGNLVDFYTEQMLIKGYFHADPHPGNILITKDAKIIMLDFGMVKTVPNTTRIAIIELIKAANEKNYELYISANKRLGTIAYEAPQSELAEFTEKMFDIFSNDNLSSESMQKLAFEVLETTRNFPFKLPSDAIYILRVSAIIEGLGTTYIENFNGIKDILPILNKNIPKALGANESIIETMLDEIVEIPFIIKDVKTVVKKASQGELDVQLSRSQIDWIAKEIKEYIFGIKLSFIFIISSFYTLLFAPDFKSLSLGLFLVGIIRMIYR